MIPNEAPWSGLEAGKTDTRRVDAKGKWNFFWAVMPKTDVALVLQLSRLPEPVPVLPKLRNIEMQFQTLPGGPILYLRLKDSAQLEPFETLCRDVVAAGEAATVESAALERAIGRTFRWHHLLRGRGPGVLSEDEQKGLLGELEIFRTLMERLGPSGALNAWTGPSGAPKDFELQADCIEVKARRGASRPHVKISSEHQLADVAGCRLWLAVLAVDRVQAPNGKTLAEVVDTIAREIEHREPGALLDWERHLADAGFDPADDYSPWRWIAGPAVFHSIAEGFPRVTAPVPLGVSNVTYNLEMSACAPYRIDAQMALSRIVGKGS